MAIRIGYQKQKKSIFFKNHTQIADSYGSYGLSIRMYFSHTKYIINQEQDRNEEEDAAT